MFAAPAHADPARARAHFEIARRYVQVDEYRKAIAEFKAAHVEEPDPAFLYNIAECHRHLGEVNDALVFYRRFLTLASPNAATRANVERRIAELQATRDASAKAASAAPPPATPTPTPRPVLAAPSPPEGPPPGVAVAVTAPTVINAAPSPEETVTSRSAAESERPFYKRGWFFVAVGVAVVGGTIGVWALSSDKGTNIPDTKLGNQGAF